MTWNLVITREKKELKGANARTYLTSCIKDVEENILSIYIHMVLVPTLCQVIQIEHLCYLRLYRSIQLSNSGLPVFPCLQVASYNQEGGWANSIHLCKHAVTGLLITFENSPNPPSVKKRLCKHGRSPLLLL